MKNFVLFLFLIFSTALITSVLALRTEGIFNGEEGNRIQRQYVAGIFAVKSCRRRPKQIGSGALVDTHYVLSAAHHFVDLSFLGNYKLKPKTFYVHLGASDLYSDSGELVPAESFYLLGYNITTGQNDLILIKTARTRTKGILPWDPVYMAGDDLQQFTVLEGRVASHGIHSTELDMDGKLRFAVANIVDSSNCDNNFSEDSPQLCIKMSKDPNNQPRGLCKYDGGAPFVIRWRTRYYLVGIASKPKQNCDDTETGAVYTDVRRFQSTLVSLISGELEVASHILYNNPCRTFSCII